MPVAPQQHVSWNLLLLAGALCALVQPLCGGTPASARPRSPAAPGPAARPARAGRTGPVMVSEVTLSRDGRRDVLLIRFDGEPTIRATPDRGSRSVTMEFENARLPATAPPLPHHHGLVQAVRLTTVRSGGVRLLVKVRPGTMVSVYRRRLEPGSVGCLTVVEHDDRPAVVGSRSGPTSLTWPVRGRLSSSFGWRIHPILHMGRMHQGIDIAVPHGTPIRAIAPGRVVSAGWRGGAGLCVVIEHPDGVRSTYMHCSKIVVRPGQRVGCHQRLAEAGETGLATGPHLHFGVSLDGRVLDPIRYLRSARPAPTGGRGEQKPKAIPLAKGTTPDRRPGT
ncbi:MAG: M23 family metallopeptidase [Candidatus Riflebacteria bacterium]|nr:M23 family metallopeptidase [Candidatus Riflebacteria bacterium]